MEEERKLYPLRFCSLQDEYYWGTEEFQLADLGYRDSLVREGWLAGNSMGELMDTYMDRIVGEEAYEFYGRQFPVCVRRIRVRGKMPLQAHPDDETASQRYDFLGKEKLWYVLRAGRDAGLCIGFKGDTDASAFYSGCSGEGPADLLNMIAPHKGQAFRIAPGTPHAAFGDVDILEIAESSPLDFRLCSWGEDDSDSEQFDPQLTLTEALDFIDYGRFKAPVSATAGTMVDIPQFSVRKIELRDPLRVSGGEAGGFVLYSCIQGGASVRIPLPAGGADFRLTEGETMLVPAECTEFSLVPVESGTILLATEVHRVEKDKYINQ